MYDVIPLLPAAVAADGKSVSPTAGGETGAHGDSIPTDNARIS